MPDTITSEKKLKKIEQQDNLDEVLYQFVRLYDRWSLEQQLTGKREAEMLKSIESFNETLEQLDALHVKIQNTIKISVREAANAVSLQIESDTGKYFRREVQKFIPTLDSSIHYANDVLQSYKNTLRSKDQNIFDYMIIAIFLGGILIGGMGLFAIRRYW